MDTRRLPDPDDLWLLWPGNPYRTDSFLPANPPCDGFASRILRATGQPADYLPDTGLQHPPEEIAP